MGIKTWIEKQKESMHYDSPEETARRAVMAYLATHRLNLHDITAGLTIPWMNADYAGVVVIDHKTTDGRLQCSRYVVSQSHRRWPTVMEINLSKEQARSTHLQS